MDLNRAGGYSGPQRMERKASAAVAAVQAVGSAGPMAAGRWVAAVEVGARGGTMEKAVGVAGHVGTEAADTEMAVQRVAGPTDLVRVALAGARLAMGCAVAPKAAEKERGAPHRRKSCHPHLSSSRRKCTAWPSRLPCRHVAVRHHPNRRMRRRQCGDRQIGQSSRHLRTVRHLPSLHRGHLHRHP